MSCLNGLEIKQKTNVNNKKLNRLMENKEIYEMANKTQATF